MKRIKSPASLEAILEYYLHFGQTAPHRYKLLVDTTFARMQRGDSFPAFELSKSLLAKRFGGSPEDYQQIALGLMQLVVGTIAYTHAAQEYPKYQKGSQNAARELLRLTLTGLSQTAGGSVKA